MDKREETKAKIITAAIECIEKHGIKDATTRNISQFADVNISAINYYFQSRENLINIVFEKTLENAFALEDIEIDKNDDYKIVLSRILKDWLQGAHAYPNISRAHMDSLVNQNQQGRIMIDKMNAFLDNVYSVLIKHNMQDNEMQRNKLYAVFSALLGHILIGNLLKDAIEEDQYIDIILDNI